MTVRVCVLQFGVCGCLLAKEMDDGVVAKMIRTKLAATKETSALARTTKMLDTRTHGSQDSSALYYLRATRRQGRPMGGPSTRAKMRVRVREKKSKPTY